MSLGDKVRSLRLKKGLTQSQLATLARVSPVTIHNIERGLFELKVSTLLELCRALDTPLNYFLKSKPAGLFERIPADTPSARLSAEKPLPRGIPLIEELHLEAGREMEMSENHGEPVSFHLVLGRIEMVSGERVVQLLPGDSFHVELFDDLKIHARTPSILIRILFPR